jgi:hypothetical protein
MTGPVVLPQIVQKRQPPLECSNESGGSWGFINSLGDYEIPPSFQSTGRFSEGLAKAEAKNRIGFVDRTGNLRIKEQFFMASDFQNGLALVQTPRDIGYINPQGEFVWKAPYVQVEFAFMPGF